LAGRVDTVGEVGTASLEGYQSQIVGFAWDEAGAARPITVIRFFPLLADGSSPAVLFCLAESHSDIKIICGCFNFLGKLTEKTIAVTVDVAS
jgi:hypothetical protein